MFEYFKMSIFCMGLNLFFMFELVWFKSVLILNLEIEK